MQIQRAVDKSLSSLINSRQLTRIDFGAYRDVSTCVLCKFVVHIVTPEIMCYKLKVGIT